MMNAALLFAGTVAIALGLAHSYMGERQILISLLRRSELTPHALRRRHLHSLRGAWHFFTIMVWTAAGLLFALATADLEGGTQIAVRVVAGYFAAFAVVVLVLSRGRHFAWLLGSVIAASAWWATLG
jgi:hypothetical protein